MHISNEEPDDVNIFTKSFSHILNSEFHHPYYTLQIFLFSYLIQLMLGYISPIITAWIAVFLDQPIFRVSNPKISQRRLRLIDIRDLYRFLQPGLISSMTFEKEPGLSNANHKIMYKVIMELISNDRKHKATLTQTS